MKLRLFLENQLKYSHLIQKEFFKRKISWDFPLSLNIEVTNNCNFDCLMCPRKKGNRGFGNMDFNLYQKIIDQVVREGRKLYTLTLIKDGEPLLHPDLPKMVALAKEKGVAHRVEIFTNGSLLDESHGRALVEAGLDVLNVSLNAASAKTHQKISGTSLYNNVVKNLKSFMRLRTEMGSKKPLVIAKAIKMEEASGELAEFKKTWEGIVDQVIISPFHNYGGSLSGREGGLLKRWPCLVLWFNPVINFNGEVTTCCANYLRNELVLGDVTRQTLKQIWQNSQYKKLRQAHLDGNLKGWPTCASCNYWQIFVNLEGWLTRKEKKNC